MAKVPTQEQLNDAIRERSLRTGINRMMGLVDDVERLPGHTQAMLNAYMPEWAENEWGRGTDGVMNKDTRYTSSQVSMRIRKAFTKALEERRFK